MVPYPSPSDAPRTLADFELARPRRIRTLERQVRLLNLTAQAALMAACLSGAGFLISLLLLLWGTGGLTFFLLMFMVSFPLAVLLDKHLERAERELETLRVEHVALMQSAGEAPPGGNADALG